MDATILVDDREKHPLVFPKNMRILHPDWPGKSSDRVLKVQVEQARLVTGDYAIKGYEWACCIERKKNLNEIATNLLNPRRRKLFVAELERLKEGCREPILLMEGHIGGLLHPTSQRPYFWKVVDAFQRLMLRYDIQMVFAPMATAKQRKEAGEFAARLLVNGVLNHASSIGD